jgi:alpha-beta hydrolase superfamily lysophospholipase
MSKTDLKRKEIVSHILESKWDTYADFYQELFVQLNKKRFFYRMLVPKDPVAMVIIFHGCGESSHNYSRIANTLCDGGIGVFALDQEGHGKSKDGDNLFTGIYLELVSNGINFINHLVAKHREIQKVPVFLLGHAMGATTTLQISLEVKRLDVSLGGIMLSSPAFVPYAAPNPVAYSILNGVMWLPGIESLVGSKHFTTIDVTHLTGILEVQDEFKSQKEKSLRFFDVYGYIGKAIIEMGTHSLERAKFIIHPVLTMQSTNDKVISTKHTHEFHSNLKSDKQYYEFDGGHDLLHDKNAIKVENAMLDWLGEHCDLKPKIVQPTITNQTILKEIRKEIETEVDDTTKQESDVIEMVESKEDGEVTVVETFEKLTVPTFGFDELSPELSPNLDVTPIFPMPKKTVQSSLQSLDDFEAHMMNGNK